MKVSLLASLLFGQSYDSITPYALIGALMFPLPSAALIYAEYRCLFHQSIRATSAITVAFLLFPIGGLAGLTRGLLGLFGWMPLDIDFETWGEVVISSLFLGYFLLIGLLHLKRWRFLRHQRQLSSSTEPA